MFPIKSQARTAIQLRKVFKGVQNSAMGEALNLMTYPVILNRHFNRLIPPAVLSGDRSRTK